MFEKANHLQDPKNRIALPGSPFFRTLRILWTLLQNPKNRMTSADVMLLQCEHLALGDDVLNAPSRRQRESPALKWTLGVFKKDRLPKF